METAPDSVLCINCRTRSRRGQTPSQRLRFALWTLANAKNVPDAEWEAYYLDKMNSLIDMVYQKAMEAGKPI